MSNNYLVNNMLDDSYYKFIKSVDNLNDNYYKVFDNNSKNDHVIINGKIDKIVNYPKNLNDILNIDITYGNIVHIPMVNNLLIKYGSKNIILNMSDLNIDNSIYTEDNEIKILSAKVNKNIIYQDILIQTNNNLIILQLYKFIKPVENITHGAFIIYQNDYNDSSQNNTIFYTKNKTNKLIKKSQENIRYL